MATSTFRQATLAGLLVALHGAPAHALNAKSWVSKAGSDANDCSLAHPCATFQRAHDQTAPGGEVGVLTPGDYGAATGIRLSINKSVNITNDGSGEASILATPGGFAVEVDSGQGDVVSLRGLVIDGLGSGHVGIQFQGGLALHVQNCVIRNFEGVIPDSGFGILFLPNFHSSLGGSQRIFLSDTLIYNNGGGGHGTGGIFVQWEFEASNSADLVLDRVRLENNVDGISFESLAPGGGIHVIVRDSVLSGNAANGLHAFTAPGNGPAFAVMERSSLVNNRKNGILADGPGATILLNDSTVARNAAGISTVNSGQLISYRNNRINNNIGPDGTPTSFLTLN